MLIAVNTRDIQKFQFLFPVSLRLLREIAALLGNSAIFVTLRLLLWQAEKLETAGIEGYMKEKLWINLSFYFNFFVILIRLWDMLPSSYLILYHFCYFIIYFIFHKNPHCFCFFVGHELSLSLFPLLTDGSSP